MALLQVELYADYEPERLMGFLVSSQAYSLEAAAELCERRNLVREQVFVLGRMGNSRHALNLIISRLADIPQACPCFVTPTSVCACALGSKSGRLQSGTLRAAGLERRRPHSTLLLKSDCCAAGHRVCADAAG
jgi:hypothetical protein